MDKVDLAKNIATTLAGVYSWASNDLEKDFVDYILDLHPELSPDVALKVFRSFDQIDPIIRDDARFGLFDFVNDTINSL